MGWAGKSRKAKLEPTIDSTGSHRVAGAPHSLCEITDAVGSAAICFSGAISGLSAHFTTGSSQLMHWRSVRPDKVITGTRCFPHLGQCVIGFMRSLPIFSPVTRNCSFCSIRAFGRGASVPRPVAATPASTKAGDASRSGGNGEQQIEIACRGANTHQEARAASAPHSSAAGIAREKLG
jgi:hypothetical protein